jgi:hypothetical protein
VHEVRPAQRGALASLFYGESAEGVAAVVADGQVRRLMSPLGVMLVIGLMALVVVIVLLAAGI